MTTTWFYWGDVKPCYTRPRSTGKISVPARIRSVHICQVFAPFKPNQNPPEWSQFSLRPTWNVVKMYRLSLKPLQKPLESSPSLILPPYSQMERPQTLLRTIRFTPENHSHTPELNCNPLVERFLDSTMQSHFRRISTSVSWLSCINVTVEVTDQIKDASDAIVEV